VDLCGSPGETKGGLGGLGARVTSALNVQPGQVLHIRVGVGVGGKGGIGGANGGAATDIRIIPTYYHCTDTSNCCQGYNNLYIDSTYAGGLGDCNNIERLILASSVKVVTSFGFNACQYLKNVTILGNGLQSIDYQGFCQCFSLQSISFPESFTSFGMQALWGAYNLRSIKLSSRTTAIGYYCFVHNRNLVSLDIPEGVQYIYYQAFEGCSSLVQLKLPDSLTDIDRYTIVNLNTKLTITSFIIYSQAFANCNKLFLENIDYNRNVARNTPIPLKSISSIWDGVLNLIEVEFWNSTSKISNSQVSASMSSGETLSSCFDNKIDTICRTVADGSYGSLSMNISHTTFNMIKVYNIGGCNAYIDICNSRILGASVSLSIGERVVWNSSFYDIQSLYIFDVSDDFETFYSPTPAPETRPPTKIPTKPTSSVKKHYTYRTHSPTKQPIT